MSELTQEEARRRLEAARVHGPRDVRRWLKAILPLAQIGYPELFEEEAREHDGRELAVPPPQEAFCEWMEEHAEHPSRVLEALEEVVAEGFWALDGVAALPGRAETLMGDAREALQGALDEVAS